MTVTFEHKSLDTLKSLLDLWVQTYDPFFETIRVSKTETGFKGIITYPEPGEAT